MCKYHYRTWDFYSSWRNITTDRFKKKKLSIDLGISLVFVSLFYLEKKALMRMVFLHLTNTLNEAFV